MADSPGSFERAPLWRAIAVFRLAALVYAAALVAARRADYQHWAWAWAVLGAMTLWTVLTSIAYARPGKPSWPLLSADLLVTVAALFSTELLQYPRAVTAGAMPVTAIWLAGPAMSWAIAGGIPAGMAAAIVLGGCDLALRGQPMSAVAAGPAIDGPVLLLFSALVVGYIATLTQRAHDALRRATEIEAASRERERIARGIHDSVLQVLALVQRRGAEAGGEAAAIGRLAGEQEAALRALITADADRFPAADGVVDLAVLLSRQASSTVSVITPGNPVRLPDPAARETAAAVQAALDNVRRHAGADAHAWVLLDDEGTAVTVTVRDNGPGIPPGRLTEAVTQGRLGVSQSIRGRMRDIGGAAAIDATPGAGTEVRLTVPRGVGDRG